MDFDISKFYADTDNKEEEMGSRLMWVVISGGTWFCIGLMLLTKGVKLIIQSSLQDSPGQILALASNTVHGKEEGLFLLVLVALLVGFFKGKFVLAKTARRVVSRIASLPEPLSLFSVYSKGYLLILGSMVFLGMMMQWLSFSCEIRGLIDIAVGSALVNGAAFYFRALPSLKR